MKPSSLEKYFAYLPSPLFLFLQTTEAATAAQATISAHVYRKSFIFCNILICLKGEHVSDINLKSALSLTCPLYTLVNN